MSHNKPNNSKTQHQKPQTINKTKTTHIQNNNTTLLEIHHHNHKQANKTKANKANNHKHHNQNLYANKTYNNQKQTLNKHQNTKFKQHPPPINSQSSKQTTNKPNITNETTQHNKQYHTKRKT